ncbi:hypothetical protein D3C81_1899410 [compost metagenome]
MLFGQRTGGVLEAEYAQLFRRRADESDVVRCAGFGERGVLREKPVTGMDRRGAALLGDGENFVDRQIRAGSGAFTEAVRFIGVQNVQAGGVGFGIHGHAFDLQ